MGYIGSEGKKLGLWVLSKTYVPSLLYFRTAGEVNAVKLSQAFLG